ncbi:hypothetical protein BJV74DRAFT_879261 [Russula compacta]|nr:hypothetical protein BJV74DRAFT_879261 [Russula compacta]
MWFGPNNPRNLALRIAGDTQLNQVGEIAVIIALITDSKYTIKGLTTHLQHWEDQGWIAIRDTNLFCRSDRLAQEGAEKLILDDLSLEVPDEFNIQGAKLKTMSQALSYRGIMKNKPRLVRVTSHRNIVVAARAIKEINKTQETAVTIWMDIKEDQHKILGYQDRARCTLCDKTESMSHILLECQTSPGRAAWEHVRCTWPHRQQENVDNRRKAKKKGQTRLLQILISEVSHLIWVLRWHKAITNRFATDRVTAKKIKRSMRYTRLINKTWKQTQAGYPL